LNVDLQSTERRKMAAIEKRSDALGDIVVAKIGSSGEMDTLGSQYSHADSSGREVES
jgi:hypothetical protein